MTTRRGFIQGILVGITALVLPKVAANDSVAIDELDVELEHGILIDGRDCYTWPDAYIDSIHYLPTIFMIEDKTITLVAEGPLPSHCKIVGVGDFADCSLLSESVGEVTNDS